MRTGRPTLIAAVGAVVTALLVLGLTPHVARADGAIARGGGRVGISYNLPDMERAEHKALRECGRRECRIIFRFAHACAAYASSRDGAYGYARAENPEIARRHAIEKCRHYRGRDCAVRVSGCDRRNGQRDAPRRDLQERR